MTELHITNGDGAANLLKASSISGDVLVWRDPMHHGPFPPGDFDTISEVRARYLVGDSNDPAEAIRDFKFRNTHLEGFRTYGTVVLWFEHDLLDQLQILQILDWFADRDLGDTVLQMVCINAFPGMESFRGLGQLTPEQIATLDSARKPISRDQIWLAQQGWAAFRCPDPRKLVGYLETDLSALPFLKASLLRHLQEYPWHDTGLTRSELQILTLIEDDNDNPIDVFIKNMDLEDALFMGDWPTFAIIERLCSAGLLTCTPDPFWYHAWTQQDRKRFRAQQLQLTETGKQVTAGLETAFDVIPRDHWLGGVHLDSAKPMWTWHDDAGQVRLRQP